MATTENRPNKQGEPTRACALCGASDWRRSLGTDGNKAIALASELATKVEPGRQRLQSPHGPPDRVPAPPRTTRTTSIKLTLPALGAIEDAWL